ncbi:hypothetical protein EDC39_102200 [Geothermobacter ehrlichii]|uniref:Uncharacterized protein n=1 Tax=Geothermobacter ehrlichii TaxID=213224 RepID=A0A5D3WN75_9BACT|nr:hypothetical protein [Geothermobacter ehrlichii]TYO99675.1 hypothetical protein EDC39_102200 [Geothermobacter ehrlichii]
MEYDSDYSGWGNEVLYRMCQEKPHHDNRDVIRAKLWIIGRAYSASIERKAKPGFKMEDAVDIIKASDIDLYIQELKKIERLNESNVFTLLKAHKYFTGVLKDATGIEKRSLASKYLHFHAPSSVFIYDSIANKKIRKILRKQKKHFKISRKFDDAYEAFVCRCIYYRDMVLDPKIGRLATPRRIDMELLGYRPLSD